MAGDEDWRKNADTHKMSPEEGKKAGVDRSKRPPGNNPAGVLHQRRKVPLNTTTMAVTGLVVIGTIGYFTLYAKESPEATAMNVAKVSTNVAKTEDTHPRK